jgi:predicted HAD superfamily Cof-like phosphohydrolase
MRFTALLTTALLKTILMLTNAQKILAFHEAIAAGYPSEPTVPTAVLLDLRQTLIQEEYQEVIAAFEQLRHGRAHDLSQLAHELADLLYVTYGAMAACGIDADAVFDEVHQANMRKVSGPRRPDGKILKPADWQPADVTAVLARQKKL